LESCGSG
jgi:hypothetical protein